MKILTKAQVSKVNEILEDLCPGARYSPNLHINASDVTGQHFGRFVALVPARKGHWGRLKWLCKCECGAYRLKTVSDLGNCHKRNWGCGCGWKLPAGEAAFHNLLRGYRNRARRKGLDFTLSEAEFRTLTRQPCHYCGLPPNQKKSLEDMNLLVSTLTQVWTERILLGDTLWTMLCPAALPAITPR